MRDGTPNAATDKSFPLPRFDVPEVLVLVGVGEATDWVGGGLVVKCVGMEADADKPAEL
jgi:hypothetical protein